MFFGDFIENQMIPKSYHPLGNSETHFLIFENPFQDLICEIMEIDKPIIIFIAAISLQYIIFSVNIGQKQNKAVRSFHYENEYKS